MKKPKIKLPSETPHLTRQEAAAQGLPTYIDGKVCKKNHLPTIRLTHSGWCSACFDDWVLQRQRDAIEKRKNAVKFQSAFYCRVKQPDGTYEIYGPFNKHSEALSKLQLEQAKVNTEK